jgi:hypothetical protein
LRLEPLEPRLTLSHDALALVATAPVDGEGVFHTDISAIHVSPTADTGAEHSQSSAAASAVSLPGGGFWGAESPDAVQIASTATDLQTLPPPQVSPTNTLTITIPAAQQQVAASNGGPNDHEDHGANSFHVVSLLTEFHLAGSNDETAANPGPSQNVGPAQNDTGEDLAAALSGAVVPAHGANSNGVPAVNDHDNSSPPPGGPTAGDVDRVATASPSPAPSDVFVVHSSDVAQPAAIAGDRQPRQVLLPATVLGTGIASLAPQAANDVAKQSVAATATAVVVQQQLSAPFSLPGDVGLNRSLGGTILIPQAPSDAIGSLATDVPPAWADRQNAIVADRASDDEHLPANEQVVLAVAASDGSTEGNLEGTTNSAARVAMLANLQLNFEAVDQALDAMVSEVEWLGSELVTWLDDWNVSNWGTAVGVIFACGLGSRYWWLERGRRSLQRDRDEESSSWIFIRLQSPAGQP